MVQDDKGKDKKIILFNRKMKLNNKFISIKSFIVVDMADFNVVTFPSDITVTIKFNSNFKNNHLQAIIELAEYGVIVEKNMRSKGIGKQLLNYVKKLKEEMHLSAYQKNYKAISFYQREDFVIQSESIDNDTNEKELLMSWKK